MIEGLSTGKRRIFIAVALVVAIVYVVIALATDAEQLKVALVQLGISGCVLVLGLSAANYVLRFLRWQYYLGKLGRVVPTGRHLAYYLAGFAFTVSPGKAGEAVRSHTCETTASPMPRASRRCSSSGCWICAPWCCWPVSSWSITRPIDHCSEAYSLWLSSR